MFHRRADRGRLAYGFARPAWHDVYQKRGIKK